MELPVRRLVVRSSVVAALAVGAVVCVSPQAMADGESGGACPDGTARIFFGNSTNSCVTGTTSHSNFISKVCSVGDVDVTVTVQLAPLGTREREPVVTELSTGHCARFDRFDQKSSTVTVKPA
ncbi:hypothetical protein [Nocardia sp. NPDC052566]|uniref:hypothetical protein n=1 Tax=Nocardia sp. NPDC052566 TaxID=3364330 RepID=UPI0037CBF3F2